MEEEQTTLGAHPDIECSMKSDLSIRVSLFSQFFFEGKLGG